MAITVCLPSSIIPTHTHTHTPRFSPSPLQAQLTSIVATFEAELAAGPLGNLKGAVSEHSRAPPLSPPFVGAAHLHCGYV